MNKTWMIPLTKAAAVPFTACGGKRTAPEPIAVSVESVSAAAGCGSAYYSGTIEALNSIPLSFQTAGTVSEVQVREGQSVRKGQPLAALDCRSNEATLRMAEAKNKQAQDAFRRFEPMFKNGNLAEIKMVEIETARTEAEQALVLAQKSAGDCRLTAPADGVISRRDMEPGSSAIPGKPVLRLDSVDQVYAAISVPEAEISAIQPGSRAAVEIGALTQGGAEGPPGADHRDSVSAYSSRLRGVVRDTGVSADPLSRTYQVRVLLNNPGRSILPGMICDVHLAGRSTASLLLVPPAAVTADSETGEYVYVADGPEGTVKRRAVRTAGFAQGKILVLSGLTEGELVVSSGVQKLSDGAKISARPL